MEKFSLLLLAFTEENAAESGTYQRRDPLQSEAIHLGRTVGDEEGARDLPRRL
jgi:predicted RNA polymerase sigma factor